MGPDLLEKLAVKPKKEFFRVNGGIRWVCIAMIIVAVTILVALLILVGVRFFFDVMYPPQ